MKQYSIKTIDGNRYETNNISMIVLKAGIRWICFNIENGVKYISVNQIVSLTEREVDE